MRTTNEQLQLMLVRLELIKSDMQDFMRRHDDTQDSVRRKQLSDTYSRAKDECHALEALLTDHEELSRDLQDAGMLIRRLCRRAQPCKTVEQSIDWINRKGLQGNILRDSQD